MNAPEQMQLATILPLPAVTANDLADARDAALRDADTFADWLAAQCMSRTADAWPVMRDKTAEDFKHIPVHALVSLSTDRGQPAAVRTAALDAITERYLADDDTQAYVIRLANEIAIARAEDDAADEVTTFYGKPLPAFLQRQAA